MTSTAAATKVEAINDPPWVVINREGRRCHLQPATKAAYAIQPTLMRFSMDLAEAASKPAPPHYQFKGAT
jgi:hypothetical protein